MYNYDFVVLFGEEYELNMPVKTHGYGDQAEALYEAIGRAQEKANRPATAAIFIPGDHPLQELRKCMLDTEHNTPYRFTNAKEERFNYAK